MGVREQHGVGAEKIIQQFKALEVLPDDLDLVPRTHTEAKSHLYPKDRQFCLLDSVYTQQAHGSPTDTSRQNTHRHKTNKVKVREGQTESIDEIYIQVSTKLQKTFLRQKTQNSSLLNQSHKMSELFATRYHRNGLIYMERNVRWELVGKVVHPNQKRTLYAWILIEQPIVEKLISFQFCMTVIHTMYTSIV